jgi:hypothetical protein
MLGGTSVVVYRLIYIVKFRAFDVMRDLDWGNSIKNFVSSATDKHKTNTLVYW